MRALVVGVVGVLLFAGCGSEFGNQDGPTRPGCVSEKMAEGYTADFAQDICEGQHYMYGEEKPQYEVELEEFDREMEEFDREMDQLQRELDQDLDELQRDIDSLDW